MVGSSYIFANHDVLLGGKAIGEGHVCGLADEGECVAKIAFRFVGDVKTTDAVFVKLLAREEVEDMLDIFH